MHAYHTIRKSKSKRKFKIRNIRLYKTSLPTVCCLCSYMIKNIGQLVSKYVAGSLVFRRDACHFRYIVSQKLFFRLPAVCN